MAARRSGPLAIRLGVARTLSGTVQEAPGRAPLAGITVVAFAGTPAGRAVTDAQGRYRIEGLAPGTYQAAATGSGFAPDDDETDDGVDLTRSESGRRDLLLVRLPSLHGRVEDEQRRPVVGAAVGLAFKGPQMYAVDGLDFDTDPGAHATVRTGADGGFTLPLPLTRQEQAVKALGYERSVVVLKQGFAVGTAPLPAAGAPAVPLVVALRRGVELRGRVVAGDGTPVADAGVFLAESGTLASTLVRMHVVLEAAQDEHAWVRTDGAGLFSVRVHPAAHDLSVRKEGYARRTLRDQEAGGAPLQVLLDPAATVSGRIVRADGRGVAGAQVTTTSELRRDPREPAESDADGVFVVGDLNPGLYSLFVQHPGLGTLGTRMVEAPARDVVFTLPPAGAVRGRAVDAVTREELRRFTVGVAPADDDRSWQRQGTVDEATGAFVVEDVPEGTVKLTASAEGYANTTVDDLTIVADAEAAEVEVALRADTPVTGQVTNESGAPVPAHLTGSARDGSASASATADAEGRYELRGLPAGEVELRAQARGYAPETRTADTRLGGRVDVVLKRGLALRGEVVGGDGAPVPNAGCSPRGPSRGGIRLRHDRRARALHARGPAGRPLHGLGAGAGRPPCAAGRRGPGPGDAAAHRPPTPGDGRADRPRGGAARGGRPADGDRPLQRRAGLRDGAGRRRLPLPDGGRAGGSRDRPGRGGVDERDPPLEPPARPDARRGQRERGGPRVP